jgi:hypothetical protein
MTDERFRSFKAEGPDYQYQFCIICDNPDDGTMLLQEFGICRDCSKKILDQFPESLYQHIGRLLLYASKKQLILGDAKPKNLNKLGVGKNDRSLYRHGKP